MTDINTQNDFAFGSNGKTISPAFPVIITTRQQAYRTAAWILLMGEMCPNEDPSSDFDEILDAITST